MSARLEAERAARLKGASLERAKKIMLEYNALNFAPDSPQLYLTDLLVDFMHYAEGPGLDFALACRTARTVVNHDNELLGGRP